MRLDNTRYLGLNPEERGIGADIGIERGIEGGLGELYGGRRATSMCDAKTDPGTQNARVGVMETEEANQVARLESTQ